MFKKLWSFTLSLLMLVSVGLVPMVSVGLIPSATSSVEAANTIYYSKTSLTGGAATALDYIDGNLLADGDWAYVSVSGKLYVYKLNASSGAAESSPTIISPDTNAGTKRWILQNQVSWRINKTQADSPYSAAAADLDGQAVFTNTGATGQTIIQLPAGADGYKFRGVVTAAQYLQIKANGTETIRFLGTQTAAGGYIRSNVIGNIVDGVWTGTEWVITGIGGAWTYDS